MLLGLSAAGCAQAELNPDAGIDGPPPADAPPIDAPPIDAMVGSGFFLDDVAADFSGGTLEEAVVESWGAVAPRAYYTGGLRLRGSDTGIFATTAATWGEVQALTYTAAQAPARTLSSVWGAGTPAGAGLTSGDDFSLAADGEIFLEAGTWTFYLLADDRAFVELEPPGGGGFVRVVSATWPTESSGGFDAPATGWYPIRVAHCEQVGDAQLRLEASGPGVVRAPVSRQRLRHLASGVTGLAVHGFDDSRLLGDSQATIDRTAPGGSTWGSGLPADLGITGGDDFSVRWMGQVRIDAGGDFVFRYLTEDGQRLWIDGVLVLDQFDDASHDASTSPIHLEPGWHDLVIDHSESSGAAQAFLGVTSGPELVGASLPVERLRPVEARSERHEAGADHADRTIPDVGVVEAAITIDAPAGAKTHGVDVGWTFDHPYRGDLEISLVAPDGSITMVRDHAGGATAGSVTERMHVGSLDETNATGVWRLRVRDTVSLDVGTLRDFQLTVHHRGGRPPITPAASFVSTVKDLGATVTAYQSFGWGARLGPGSALRVYARSGDTEDALLLQPWSSPLVDPEAGAPPVPTRRFFQYRLELDSDGDGAAMVDWVRLDTRTEIP